MLGEFINRILVMVLAFAFPAFECFKTVERNRVDIAELRFWCQYWIIVAVLSIIERFGDIFISWVPLYGEMKLALIIYLWYPKTKGTNYVYDRFLRPFVSRHETDIDRNLQDLRYRVWDLAIYYYHNCTELGQGAFFQVVEYLLNQSSRLKGGGGRSSDTSKYHKKNDHDKPSSPPPPVPPADFIPILTQYNRKNQLSPDSPRHKGGPTRRWPPAPSAPPMPTSLFRSQAPSTPKSDVFQMEPSGEAQKENIHFVEQVFEGGEACCSPSHGGGDKGPQKQTHYLARLLASLAAVHHLQKMSHRASANQPETLVIISTTNFLTDTRNCLNESTHKHHHLLQLHSLRPEEDGEDDIGCRYAHAACLTRRLRMDISCPEHELAAARLPPEEDAEELEAAPLKRTDAAVEGERADGMAGRRSLRDV